jgi:hypothetical protein
MKCVTYPTDILWLICASAASGADSFDPATKQLRSVAGIYSNVAEPFLYSYGGDFGLAGSTDGALPESPLIQGSAHAAGSTNRLTKVVPMR